ncbi:MAG: SpoIID/LytB domain-containing protein [Candidatus Krumholzibacteria bacterium]|nr:SpoIID/LytB domain-containing protein [Candidatus Krumholzibacteria bacterium]
MRHAIVGIAILALAAVISCGRPKPVYISGDPEAPDEQSAVSGTVPSVHTEADRSPRVRVLILETSDRIRVEVDGARVEVAGSDVTGRANSQTKIDIRGRLDIARKGKEVKIAGGGRMIASSSRIVIRPDSGMDFSIEGKTYRGDLLLRNTGSRIQAINLIGVDDYIKGVLPSEIGYLRKGQYEAYRVQAVAARSYAMGKLEEKKDSPYDLKATIMDQVYRGIGGENAEASAAVDETRGLVGLWNGRVITAYYSSCCGGHTADIRDGWPWKADFPYLYGSRDSEGRGKKSFCRDSGHFRWEHSWDGRALLQILKKTLPAELGNRVVPFSRLVDIKVDGLSKSGRVKALVFVTDRGRYRVEGDRLRWVMRPKSASGSILRSTLFKMKVTRSGGRVASVSLKGAGNGHGTGMCQNGAIKMAEEGYDFREILLHYYPGITIERIYQNGQGPDR